VFNLPPLVYGTPATPLVIDVFSDPTPANPAYLVGHYQAILRDQHPLSPGSQWILLYFRITAASALNTPGTPLSRDLDIVIKAQSPMTSFLSTLSELKLGAGATFNGDVMAPVVIVENDPADPTTVNGAVNYRNSITIFGSTPGSMIVNNSSTYTKPFLNSGGVKISKAITPQSNMTFYSVDLTQPDNKYRRKADPADPYFGHGVYVTTDFTVNGAGISPASLGAVNGIVYSTKDIYIGGTTPTTFSNSMTFVAEGNIFIKGSIGPVAGTGAHIGLFSGKSIIVQSTEGTQNLELNGVFGVANEVFTTETAVSPWTYQSLKITGSLALTGFNNGTSAINMSDYGSRIYNNDATLVANPPPAVDYLASVVEWSIDGRPAL
jgi:hypothetical protein